MKVMIILTIVMICMLMIGLPYTSTMVYNQVNSLMRVGTAIQSNGVRMYAENTIQKALRHEENVFDGLDQDDPTLVSYVRRFELRPPSLLPYNLTHPTARHFSQYDQSQFAQDTFLRDMDKGFFIEVGALDGEDKSNSLFFEKYHGWRGLLVEPDPEIFATLTSRHRKAYSVQAGLAFSTKAGISDFRPGLGTGRVLKGYRSGNTIKVLPLYSILLALNVTQVDFFSLDIEGDELKVLRTLPWDKIRVRLLCIEVNHIPGGPKAAIRFMEARGYVFLGLRNIDAWFGLRDLLQETMGDNLETYIHTIDLENQKRTLLTEG